MTYGQAEFEQDQMDRGRDRDDAEIADWPDGGYAWTERLAEEFHEEDRERAEALGLSWRDWGER